MKIQPVALIWQGIGIWRWPSLALIMLSFALTPYMCSGPDLWREHGVRPLTNGRVMLETRGDFHPGNILEIRVTLTGLEAQELKLGFNGKLTGNTTTWESFVGKNGLETGMSTSFEVPSHSGVFTIELQDANGGTVAWRIADRRPAPALTAN